MPDPNEYESAVESGACESSDVEGTYANAIAFEQAICQKCGGLAAFMIVFVGEERYVVPFNRELMMLISMQLAGFAMEAKEYEKAFGKPVNPN